MADPNVQEETENDSDSDTEEENKIKSYRKAGKIAYEVLHETKDLVKRGVGILEICESAERLTLDKGGRIAFPCNVTVDNIAAHYTSPFNDTSVIAEDAKLCKLDVGVHIDGYIADTALTVCFDPDYERVFEAAQKGFDAAIEIIRPGTNPQTIGERVEEVIKDDYGFLPLRELTGHQIDQWELHGAKVLPNIAVPFSKAEAVIEEGEAFALETFATTGSGSIHGMMNRHYIYELLPIRPRLRTKTSRNILKFIWNESRTLPFAERWIVNQFNAPQVRLVLRQLVTQKHAIEHNVLADIDGSYVAQYEHTFLVTEDGVEITTLPPFVVDEESTGDEEE